MNIAISILTLLGDLLFKLMGNKNSRTFIIKKLDEVTNLSDNKIDDTVVHWVGGLLGNEDNIDAAKAAYDKHVPRGRDTDLIQQLKDKVSESDNAIDDTIVSVVESALKNEKNIDKVVEIVNRWSSDDKESK